MLSYNSNFGKIFMGEDLSVIFSVMNNSASHALADIKIRVTYAF